MSQKEAIAPYTLSPEQLQFYWDNGYLLIKNLIDTNTLEICRKRFLEIVNNATDGASYPTVIKELNLVKAGATGEESVNKVQEVHWDGELSRYSQHARLAGALRRLAGARPRALHSMLVNKPPRAAAHPPHQDMFYFPLRPVDGIVGAWTAMDPVREDNGALYVVAGSHRARTLYPHYKMGPRALYHGVRGFPAGTALPMAPGDTLLLHPLLVHGSGENRTQNYRKAISCHYASQECEFTDETQCESQKQLFRDIENVARKRGLDISYVDIWKHKSKLIDVVDTYQSSKL